MNCLLLLFVIPSPVNKQVDRGLFSFKDEVLINSSLSEFERSEYEELLRLSPQRLSSERYDSLNMRFVGSWPHGPAWTVIADTARNLAFCGSGGTLLILDVSDPANPVVLSDKIRTRGVVRDLYYDESIGCIYIAAGDGGLEIWDVTDSLNPQKLSRLDIPGFAYGLAASGDYAYVADMDYGLRVIDISTPENPTMISLNDTVAFARKVRVSGNYAYVIDPVFGKLWVFDVSEPSIPLAVGSYDTPGSWGIDISDDNYLYVAAVGLRVFDISEPSTPSEVTYYEISGSWTVGVEISGDYAYLADRDNGLRAIDISTPSDPHEEWIFPTEDWANGVAVSGNYAYVSDCRDGLRIIDFSNPLNINEVGYFDTPAYTMGVEISGDYAYLANETDGLRIIDISDPGNPSEVGSCDTPDEAGKVAVSGNYAYIADDDAGLRIIDISDPENPNEVSSYDTHFALEPWGCIGEPRTRPCSAWPRQLPSST